LDEINQEDKVDAYTYLSADGLRLYYTTDFGSVVAQNLAVSSRASTNDTFGTPQVLDSNITSGAFSSWLTNDELGLYYMNGAGGQSNLLMYATRASLNDGFQFVCEITLQGRIASFVSGPSLNPAGNELFLFASDQVFNIYSLQRYERIGQFEYQYMDSIVFPPSYQANPSQISKSGDFYYCSADTMGANGSILATRLFRLKANASGKFEFSPNYLDDLVDLGMNVSQVSVSDDPQEMIFVQVGVGGWAQNDLWSAKDDQLNVISLERSPNNLSIYPNPNNGEQVFITGNVDEVKSIEVLDYSGRVISQNLTWTRSEMKTKLNLSMIRNSGVYFIRLIGESTQTLKLVIEK
jgi:hypothetical protein